MRYDLRGGTEVRSRLRLRSTVPGANNRLDIQVGARSARCACLPARGLSLAEQHCGARGWRAAPRGAAAACLRLPAEAHAACATRGLRHAAPAVGPPLACLQLEPRLQSIVSWDREDRQELPLIGEAAGRARGERLSCIPQTAACRRCRRRPLCRCCCAPHQIRAGLAAHRARHPNRSDPTLTSPADVRPDEEAEEGMEARQHRRGMSPYVFGEGRRPFLLAFLACGSVCVGGGGGGGGHGRLQGRGTCLSRRRHLTDRSPPLLARQCPLSRCPATSSTCPSARWTASSRAEAPWRLYRQAGTANAAAVSQPAPWRCPNGCPAQRCAARRPDTPPSCTTTRPHDTPANLTPGLPHLFRRRHPVARTRPGLHPFHLPAGTPRLVPLHCLYPSPFGQPPGCSVPPLPWLPCACLQWRLPPTVLCPTSNVSIQTDSVVGKHGGAGKGGSRSKQQHACCDSGQPGATGRQAGRQAGTHGSAQKGCAGRAQGLGPAFGGGMATQAGANCDAQLGAEGPRQEPPRAQAATSSFFASRALSWDDTSSMAAFSCAILSARFCLVTCGRGSREEGGLDTLSGTGQVRRLAPRPGLSQLLLPLLPACLPARSDWALLLPLLPPPPPPLLPPAAAAAAATRTSPSDCSSQRSFSRSSSPSSACTTGTVDRIAHVRNSQGPEVLMAGSFSRSSPPGSACGTQPTVAIPRPWAGRRSSQQRRRTCAGTSTAAAHRPHPPAHPPIADQPWRSGARR